MVFIIISSISKVNDLTPSPVTILLLMATRPSLGNPDFKDLNETSLLEILIKTTVILKSLLFTYNN